LTSIANGLTNPGYASGSFGEALYFYSGDLQGNLWRFNFANGLGTSAAANAVKVNSGVKVPLSIAKDAANNLQPITVSPVVTSALNTGYMVTFGTGKFIEPNDASTVGPQTMYGIWDFFSTTNSDYAIGRSKLFPRSIVLGTTTTTVSGNDTFTFGTGASGSYRGWYADLPASGERVATEGTAGLGFVGFNSTIPDGSCSGDGTSRSMCFGSLYGQATCSFELLTIGIGGKPSIITIEDGSATDAYSPRSSTGRRLATVRQSLISTGTKITDAGNVAASTSQVTPVVLPGGRMGWREVRNFKDN
jgi:type IV pilus assembly protein PilY1